MAESKPEANATLMHALLVSLSLLFSSFPEEKAYVRRNQEPLEVIFLEI